MTSDQRPTFGQHSHLLCIGNRRVAMGTAALLGRPQNAAGARQRPSATEMNQRPQAGEEYGQDQADNDDHV